MTFAEDVLHTRHVVMLRNKKLRETTVLMKHNLASIFKKVL